jgi:hypothetical protein
MTHKAPLSLRTASAAIAAVLALPSTSVLAHELTAPAATPTAPAPQIILPQPVPPTEPTQPAPGETIPQPPPAPVAAEPTTAPVAAAPARRAPPAASRSAPRNAAVAAAPAPIQSAEETSAPAVADLPVEDSGAVATPPFTNEPVAPATVTNETVSDDGLSTTELGLICGAVAIGGILGVALLNRRRRDPDAPPFDVIAASKAPPPPVPQPRAEVPSPAVAPAAVTNAAAPVRQPQMQAQTSVPTSIGPRGTKPRSTAVGRHEAMVDDGPTADNPFLTRRNRLRRARFLDKQEQQANESTVGRNDWLDDSRRQYRATPAR